MTPAGLPTPPDDFDFGKNFPGLSDILGNDELGDCTSAGWFHVLMAILADAGAPKTFTKDDAVKFYSLTTGYVPGNPDTDQGGNEVSVLSYLASKGIDGNGTDKILGFLTVDTSNADEVKSLAYHFGGTIYMGAYLPKQWEQVSGPGYVWDVKDSTGAACVSQPDAGHCFVGCLGANKLGLKMDSWGLPGLITYPAIDKFCCEFAGGNCFVILTQDILDRAKSTAPDGMDWISLVKAFDGFGANVPIPTAPPTFPAVTPQSVAKRIEQMLETEFQQLF
jgi:hypothetical protein